MVFANALVALWAHDFRGIWLTLYMFGGNAVESPVLKRIVWFAGMCRVDGSYGGEVYYI